MSTLAVMKARIADEIARSDLTSQIANAINDAIAIYQSERFRFSDSIPNGLPTFNTEVGRAVYTSADNANINSLFAFDAVFALIGNTQEPLLRQDPSAVIAYNQTGTMSGQPSWYAYQGDQLILSPIPSQVFLITLNVFRKVAAPASDDEANNPWMTTAERLIRSRAKYELAVHVTGNKDLAARMSPDLPTGATYDAYRELKGDSNRVTGRGIIRAMRF